MTKYTVNLISDQLLSKAIFFGEECTDVESLTINVTDCSVKVTMVFSNSASHGLTLTTHLPPLP